MHTHYSICLPKKLYLWDNHIRRTTEAVASVNQLLLVLSACLSPSFPLFFLHSPHLSLWSVLSKRHLPAGGICSLDSLPAARCLSWFLVSSLELLHGLLELTEQPWRHPELWIRRPQTSTASPTRLPDPPSSGSVRWQPDCCRSPQSNLRRRVPQSSRARGRRVDPCHGISRAPQPRLDPTRADYAAAPPPARPPPPSRCPWWRGAC